MLLDSNIIIYAAQPQYDNLRQLISDHVPAVSVISYIEVLGYHELSEVEKRLLEQFFAAAEVIPLDGASADKAVELRQLRRMSLGDSIVAATAMVHGLTLLTHNTKDFQWISDLLLLDPLTDV